VGRARASPSCHEALSQAAELGHPGSQYILATHLREGDLLPKDEKEAAYWFARSAKSGFPITKEDEELIEKYQPES